jgi:protein AFG1
LKDYSPSTNYGTHLDAITRAIADAEARKENEDNMVAVPGHPLRRNPLFSHLFAKKVERDTLALTKVLSSHEAAITVDSPQGLLLHGEVGTGKSFLVDLLADSLPNKKKRRWHFNTFMLETLAKLEQFRESRSNSLTGSNTDHSLVWLAKDMIENSPVIFLDEFQLPDRAASKILSSLFTVFFQLGGVLVATSNRMPDELAKASGMDFTVPSGRGMVKNWLGLGSQSKMGIFPSKNEYSTFVEVLKARCEIWNMEGGRDWRRREVEELDTQTAELVERMRDEVVGDLKGFGLPSTRTIGQNIDTFSDIPNGANDMVKTLIPTPTKYVVSSSNSNSWTSMIKSAFSSEVTEPIPWQTTDLKIYGRHVQVSRHLEGVTCWSFVDLCGGTFGPADYITLASTFHTLVLEDVPVLTYLQKNEARRLITLLDALYEARCKLIIRAEAGPDDLFFPEEKQPSLPSSDSKYNVDSNDGGDAVYPETLSEIYQDQTSPFRPNISSLEGRSGYDPDQNSNIDSIPGQADEIGRKVDFNLTNSFTGEDERFAYKRARSRLWEMCGRRWHARSEPGWWQPLPLEARRWEHSKANLVAMELSSAPTGDVKLGPSVELDKHAGLQGKEIEEIERGIQSPFREKRDPPTKIGWTHAWGMIKWGKKAGTWGQGPDGLAKRKEKKGDE